MVVPPPYVQVVLETFVKGNLTWEWLWTNVAALILPDLQETIHYAVFINYLHVGSTERPPAAPVVAGAVNHGPTMELEYAGALTTPNDQDQALDMVRHFLPGLWAPIGINAQLNQVTTGQQQIQEAILQSWQTTLAGSNHLLYQMVIHICEVLTEEDEAMIRTAGKWRTSPRTPG